MRDASGNYSEMWQAPTGYSISVKPQHDQRNYHAEAFGEIEKFWTKSAAHFWLWLRWQLEARR